VYRRLLAEVDVGAPRLVGEGEGWLLLEKVPGVELYQVGDVGVWRVVAERVAAMHRAFSEWSSAEGGVEGAVHALGLLRHDAAAVDAWPARAAAAMATPAQVRWLGALQARYGEVRDRILSLPQTVLHGELYASNVIVSDVTTPVARVCPIDWEMASAGAGLLDLAALVAGAWSDADRSAIAGSYLRVFPALGSVDLDVCRLHVAVQWLGWSPGWVAPPAHAHPWLHEAQELSQRLGLV
jgi:Ser/Thr protein kinase RdoA (MazF antagonist)